MSTSQIYNADDILISPRSMIIWTMLLENEITEFDPEYFFCSQKTYPKFRIVKDGIGELFYKVGTHTVRLRVPAIEWDFVDE
jgi:hypothetical protein